MSAVAHIGGPLDNLVQKCSRCEVILLDYRKSTSHVSSFAGYPAGNLTERDTKISMGHDEDAMPCVAP